MFQVYLKNVYLRSEVMLLINNNSINCFLSLILTTEMFNIKVLKGHMHEFVWDLLVLLLNKKHVIDIYIGNSCVVLLKN